MSERAELEMIFSDGDLISQEMLTRAAKVLFYASRPDLDNILYALTEAYECGSYDAYESERYAE